MAGSIFYPHFNLLSSSQNPAPPKAALRRPAPLSRTRSSGRSLSPLVSPVNTGYQKDEIIFKKPYIYLQEKGSLVNTAFEVFIVETPISKANNLKVTIGA